MVCESRESMPFFPVVNVFVDVDESVKFHDIVVGVSKNPIFSCQLSGIVHGMHFRAPFCGIHPGKTGRLTAPAARDHGLSRACHQLTRAGISPCRASSRSPSL